MRANATFFVLILVAIGIVAVFIVPYLRDTGHPLLAIPLFVFLGLLLFYGRHNSVARRKKGSSVTE
jgi:hypothetical protein